MEQSHHNSTYVNFDQLYNFILRAIPKSKIIVVGGSDDISRSAYEANSDQSLQQLLALMKENNLDPIQIES
jgi:hypothetical protein